jgi:hypothetical protein
MFFRQALESRNVPQGGTGHGRTRTTGQQGVVALFFCKVRYLTFYYNIVVGYCNVLLVEGSNARNQGKVRLEHLLPGALGSRRNNLRSTSPLECNQPSPALYYLGRVYLLVFY